MPTPPPKGAGPTVGCASASARRDPPKRWRSAASQTKRAQTVTKYEHVSGSSTLSMKTLRPATPASFGACVQQRKRTVAWRFRAPSPRPADPLQRSPSAKTCSEALTLDRAVVSELEKVPSVVSWRFDPADTAQAAWNCFTQRRWHHS